MAFYIFNVVSIYLYGHVIKNRKWFCILAGVQLFLILALRNEYLGDDMVIYSNGFDYIGSLSCVDLLKRLHLISVAKLTYPFSFESGYAVLNWLVEELGFGFHTFLSICAAINIYAYSKLIYRNSRIPWLSYVMLCSLGMYTSMFFLLRQDLAVSCVIFGIMQMQENNPVRSVLWLILAFTFHRAAIIAFALIPLFILGKSSVNKRCYYSAIGLWVPFLLLSGIFYRFLFDNLFSAFGKSHYLGHDLILNNNVILVFVIVILSAFFAKFREIDSKMTAVSCWATILLLYFVTIGMYNDSIGRGIEFLYLFLIFWIPFVISSYKDYVTRKITENLVAVLAIAYYAYSLQGHAIVPYVSIWGSI